MFDQLSDRLQATLSEVRARGKLNEGDVDAAMREIRLALLEADVNFKVVKSFTKGLKERDQVRAVLATLPAEQATAMLLHSLEGYSYKEIAEIQGCTMTAVRSRIARGRAAFRVTYATTEARGPS